MQTELPEGWSERVLGSVLQLRYGKSLTKSTRKQGAVPVLGSAGIVDWHDTALVEEPTIIVGRKGSVGTVYRLETPSYPIDTVFFTELKEPTSLIWLEALLNYAELSKLNEATGVPGLNRDRAHSVTVRVPPLPEQQRIAEILTAVDDSIRAGERVIEQAERVKKGLMEELLTGGLGNAAIERGEVPIGWRRFSLSEVSEMARGKFSARPRNDPQFYGGDIPFLQTGDVSNARRTISSFHQTLNEKGLSVSKKFASGTILMSIAANVGSVAILGFDAATPDSIVGISPLNFCDRDFLYYYLRRMNLYFQQLAPKTAQANLNLERLAPTPVVVPPLLEQQRIATILTAIDEQIDSEQKHVDQQKRLKRGLMDDLLTGRVRTV